MTLKCVRPYADIRAEFFLKDMQETVDISNFIGVGWRWGKEDLLFILYPCTWIHLTMCMNSFYNLRSF